MITPEAIVVVVGWSVSMFVALFIVPKLAAKRTMGMFGLEKVTNRDGDEIYAVVGPDGQAIKIPVGVKEVDGHQEAVMDYAGLAYSLPYIAGLHAANQVKLAIFSEKGVLQRKLNKAGLANAMQAGGGLDQMMPFLPKKAQTAIGVVQALSQILGIQLGRPPGQQSQNQGPQNDGYVRLQP